MTLATLRTPRPRYAPATSRAQAGEPNKGKDGRLESLRGLAIVLMVAGHVCTGPQLIDTPFGYAEYSLRYVRMPLFAALSGFVYSLAPIQAASARRFVVGKARRLLVPFVSLTILHALIPSDTLGLQDGWSSTSFAMAFLYGIHHLWFLQAIFAIFLIVGVLEISGMISNFRRWGVVFLAALGLQSVSGEFTADAIFSLDGSLRLLPYFLLGCAVQRFPETMFKTPALLAAGAGLLTGLSLQQAAWFGPIPHEELLRYRIPTIIGASSSLLLLRFFPKTSALAFLGTYAYTIYLLHMLPLTASRNLGKVVRIESPALLFVVSLTAAVLLPILAERLLKRSAILRRGVLGLR